MIEFTIKIEQGVPGTPGVKVTMQTPFFGEKLPSGVTVGEVIVLGFLHGAINKAGAEEDNLDFVVEYARRRAEPPTGGPGFILR